MNDNKKIRTGMGFTQRELAGYLGICRTQLTLFEKGNRQMPYKASTKFSRMKRWLEDAEGLAQMEAAILEEQQIEVPAFLAMHAAKCSRAVYVLERKLERMQQDYKHYLKVLATVAKLRQLPSLGTGRAEEVWLNHLEARVLKRCCECDLGQQAILSARLHAMVFLQGEIANYNRIS